MPPGDTIRYEPGTTGPPPPIGDTLTDDPVVQSTRQETEAKQQNHLSNYGTWQIIAGIAIIFVAVFLQKWLEELPKKIKAKRRQIRISKEIDLKGAVYDNWLEKYNPYYSSLSRELRDRFLRRTIEFMESKEFRFHFMEREEQVMILISGAAVQLTFGLKKFLIGFFPVINVIQKAYTVSGSDMILEGHVRVDNQSINISWKNFISDYEDYTDSENVGLHEMAHAISFDFLYGYQENRNAAFNSRFKEYIQEAGPVFKELRQGKNDLLDDYGCLNVEEFWAVSIETFFENPQEFKAKMPGFYDAISKVLNQDPMRPEKITDPGLAGLAN